MDFKFTDPTLMDKNKEEKKEEEKAMILRHSRMLVDYKGEYTGVREMRKHVAWYIFGYPHAAALRNAVNQVENIEQMEELINTIKVDNI